MLGHWGDDADLLSISTEDVEAYLHRPLRHERGIAWTMEGFEAAGIQYGQKADALTYRNLRHTFASWPAQRSVSVLMVAKLLRDSVDMVIKTHAHLMPEDLAEAVGTIDRATEEGER